MHVGPVYFPEINSEAVLYYIMFAMDKTLQLMLLIIIKSKVTL